MSASLEFAGTNEELEKYLLEFSRILGGWTARDRRNSEAPAWVVSAGAWMSANPNTLPWRARVARREKALSIESRIRALPWTRAKVARIAAAREAQLADYLTARVRGSGPEKFDLLRLREPFAPYGSGVAALSASFSWVVLTGLAALAFAFLFAALASIPLMSLSIRGIREHAAALAAAGAIPLPSPAETASIGPGFVLGAAIVFAFPIAFFLGAVHAAALAASELSARASRVPQASFLFQAILLGAAFVPFLPVLGVPLALLVPAGTHLGTTLVWSRRRERAREGRKPPIQVVIIAAALAGSLAMALAPRSSDQRFTDRVALFRDRVLLDSSIGRAVAAAYYRYTLYTAEPLKELYSADESRARRSRPIAHCNAPKQIPLLRALGFVIGQGEYRDVSVGDRVMVDLDYVYPQNPDDLQDLKAALDEISRRTFRGGGLRELYGWSWRALYYGGPIVAALLAMGALAPGVSILFRKVPPKAAILALCATFIVATLILVLVASPGDPSAFTLRDPEAARRRIAAYRAFQLESTAELAEPLLKACDDGDVAVRLWACAALGKSGDPRALPKLLERLGDPELYVRYRAAEGLGFLKDPRALEPLLRMMSERSWYEGLYALDALRRIQPGRF